MLWLKYIKKNYTIIFLKFIAILSFFCSLYYAFKYLDQPLIDLHAFRQTQTALTVYWMIKEGFILDYQTPVLGYPWSIPLEFPIYQFICAAFAQAFQLDLTKVGRFFSYVFLLLCLYPVNLITKSLKLPSNFMIIFTAFFLTSPIYMYWGRAFMIETSALFFSLSALAFGIKLIYLDDTKKIPHFAFFSIFAVLQKSTTALPVIIFLLFFLFIRRFNCQKIFFCKNFFLSFLVILIPFIFSFTWNVYSDFVKSLNPIAQFLTTKNTFIGWYSGHLSEKLDINTYREFFLNRALKINIFSQIGLLLLFTFTFFGDRNKKIIIILACSILLFILPMLLFTHVHLLHDYYQVGNTIYLIFLFALISSNFLSRVPKFSFLIPIFSATLIISNIHYFNNNYLRYESMTILDSLNSKAYLIGNFLKVNTRTDTGIIIFGQDWSSEISFFSERKAVTVPSWYPYGKDIFYQPSKYLGNLEVSAFVICPTEGGFPSKLDVEFKRKYSKAEYNEVIINDCYILTHKNV
jgi:hypothetical protein